jgi:hypothetical protein
MIRFRLRKIIYKCELELRGTVTVCDFKNLIMLNAQCPKIQRMSLLTVLRSRISYMRLRSYIPNQLFLKR